MKYRYFFPLWMDYVGENSHLLITPSEIFLFYFLHIASNFFVR